MARQRAQHVDHAAQLALLRKGWERAPYSAALADVLVLELFHNECTRPDPAVRAEARCVIDQIALLHGDTLWSNLWLGELAQMEGDWISAKQYAEIALTTLEDFDPPAFMGRLRVGFSLWSIPGEEARGEQMMLEAIDVYPGPWGHIYYALVIEDRDPIAAAEHLEAARAQWKGSTSFDDEVRAARELHRSNVQRLALVSSS